MKKMLKILLIVICILATLVCICLFSIYLDSKYKLREVYPSDIQASQSRTLTDEELILSAKLYPGLAYYRGYTYTLDGDSLYLTIYRTNLSQSKDDGTQVFIDITDDFSKVSKVYLRHHGTDALLYEREK